MILMNRLHGIKWSFELSNRKRTHWTPNTKCSRCDTNKHFERLARKQQRSIPINTIKRQKIRLHGIKRSFELSSRKRTYWFRMNNVKLWYEQTFQTSCSKTKKLNPNPYHQRTKTSLASVTVEFWICCLHVHAQKSSAEKYNKHKHNND